MSKIREQESLRATAAQYRDVGMADRAAELEARATALEPEVQAERARVVAEHGGPLAALVHAASSAAALPPTPAFTPEVMTEERKARRAALSPLLALADALEEKQRKERAR